MFSIREMSERSGVSKRTLQYYDRIGLLHPAAYSASGYRLYDETSLERLQQILLYRELAFPLRDIQLILNSPDYERNRALEQQVELLTMKKAHLENLITLARGLQMLGVKYMDFSAFDTRKIDEYAQKAKETWGRTAEYREFEEKQTGRSKEDEEAISRAFEALFVQFGQMRHLPPSDPDAQAQVERLRAFITQHFYRCTVKILLQLGRMYDGGGELQHNIDQAGGEGTAAFASAAIAHYAASHADELR